MWTRRQDDALRPSWMRRSSGRGSGAMASALSAARTGRPSMLGDRGEKEQRGRGREAASAVGETCGGGLEHIAPSSSLLILKQNIFELALLIIFLEL